MRELSGLLDLGETCGTGRSWHDTLSEARAATGGAIRSITDPIAPEGGLAILYGNLAPNGAVFKRAAADPRLWRHEGPALVFEGVADLDRRINEPGLDVTPDTVLVLRDAGPIGGPGMPEAGNIPIPNVLAREGVADMVRVSDARMSGTARGAVALHVAPEAAVGGPLALVRDRDLVRLDALDGRLDLLVEDRELVERRARLKPRRAVSTRGYGWLYEQYILQADEGCDFDFLGASGFSSET
jgi:dihydroxy-acid dehydratase